MVCLTSLTSTVLQQHTLTETLSWQFLFAEKRRLRFARFLSGHVRQQHSYAVRRFEKGSCLDSFDCSSHFVSLSAAVFVAANSSIHRRHRVSICFIRLFLLLLFYLRLLQQPTRWALFSTVSFLPILMILTNHVSSICVLFHVYSGKVFYWLS